MRTTLLETGGAPEFGPHKIVVEVPEPIALARSILELPRGQRGSTVELMRVRSEGLLVAEIVVRAQYDARHGTIYLLADVALSSEYVGIGRSKEDFARFRDFMDAVVNTAGSWLEAQWDRKETRLKVEGSGGSQWAITIRDERGGIPYAIRFERWETIGAPDSMVHVVLEPSERAGAQGIHVKGLDDVMRIIDGFANILGSLLEALYQVSKSETWPPLHAYRLSNG